KSLRVFGRNHQATCACSAGLMVAPFRNDAGKASCAVRDFATLSRRLVRHVDAPLRRHMAERHRRQSGKGQSQEEHHRTAVTRVEEGNTELLGGKRYT